MGTSQRKVKPRKVKPPGKNSRLRRLLPSREWKAGEWIAFLALMVAAVTFLPTYLGYKETKQGNEKSPNLSVAAFFAAETYTTLGEGAVRLPLSWRQLGPIIAVSGLFTFGWTSSVLVYVMTQFGTLDTHHAERKKIADSSDA